MERYAHRENIALYQRLLAETNVTKDRVRHVMLLELLAAELAKEEKPPPSCSKMMMMVGCSQQRQRVGRLTLAAVARP